MKIKASNIIYDTDGAVVELPQELDVEIDGFILPEDEIANAISDKTGWCVQSFNYEYQPQEKTCKDSTA